MTKKLLILLLVVAFLMSLIAGCSGTEDSTESESASETAVQEADETSDQSADESEETSESTEEASTVAETSVADEASAADNADEAADNTETNTELSDEPAEAEGNSYPLETEETITGWFAAFSILDSFMDDLEYNNMQLKPYVEEATGVSLNFVSLSDTVATEKFQLMIASGDWPDYTNTIDSYYSGEMLQAYEDEVILELEPDFIEANAPMYYAQLTALSDEDKAYALNDGMYLAAYSLQDGVLSSRGMCVREDWYDEIGIEITDLDSFTDFLYAIYEEYQPETTLNAEEGADVGFLDDAFGMSIPAYNESSLPIYVTDGVVYSSLTSDGYYDYIEWFSQLVSDRIIYSEFYTRGMSYDRKSAIVNDQLAVSTNNTNSVVTNYKADGTAINSMPLQAITDEDGVNNWADYNTAVSYGYSIFTSCEYADLILQFFDYFWTDEGILMGNYGIQGVTFDYDENGDIYYTDMITDDVVGLGEENAIKGYMDELWAMQEDTDRLWCTYADSQRNAAELWNSLECSYEHIYPEAAGLTTDEQDSITTQVTDIMTYVSTEILSFMTRNVELNEDNWAEYIAIMEEMGLSDVLAVYQNAYDEAMAGER